MGRGVGTKLWVLLFLPMSDVPQPRIHSNVLMIKLYTQSATETTTVDPPVQDKPKIPGCGHIHKKCSRTGGKSDEMMWLKVYIMPTSTLRQILLWCLLMRQSSSEAIMTLSGHWLVPSPNLALNNNNNNNNNNGSEQS